MSARSAVEQERGIIKDLAEEFEGLSGFTVRHFETARVAQTALDYIRALFSRAERKNAWGLSEESGRQDPYAFQHLLGRAVWDDKGLRADVLPYAQDELGDGGTLAVDETGFIKKGDKSCGVQRQYTGTSGKVDNCQVGVFLAYVTPRGRALVNAELYLPVSWISDTKRRQAAGVPKEVEFQTKPQLARSMLESAFEAGLHPAWVVADEVYGNDGGFRRPLEFRHQPYVLAVASNVYVWVAGFRQVTVKHILNNNVRPEDWQTLSAGDGAKGPRLYEWAAVRINNAYEGLARWVMFRRSLTDKTEVAHYVVHAPANTSLSAMALAAGSRWPVEECFESGKEEVGLDEYEVRSYTGWYRHITLCLVAHVFLAVARAKANDIEGYAFPKALGLSHRKSSMKPFLVRQGLLSSATP